MKMNNKTYDILKFIALKVLPALATLILALGAIWRLPYYEAIAATITAIDTFLGTILGISSNKYAQGQAIVERIREKELEVLEKKIKEVVQDADKDN